MNRFDMAMVDKGSDNRAMFITGTRGSGKTALLEQLSIRAKEKRRTVIDLGPENTVAQLIYELTGYDLIVLINSNNPKKTHKVSDNEVEESIKTALTAYEQRALMPLVEELPEIEKNYLLKMSECLDDERLARTSDIAARFGVSQNKLSRARAHLIDHGIIAAPEHGKVMFCIPYLADYVKKDSRIASSIEIARQRRV